MKRFHLEEEERRTLFEMGLWHPYPRVRRRAVQRDIAINRLTNSEAAMPMGTRIQRRVVIASRVSHMDRNDAKRISSNGR